MTEENDDNIQHPPTPSIDDIAAAVAVMANLTKSAQDRVKLVMRWSEDRVNETNQPPIPENTTPRKSHMLIDPLVPTPSPCDKHAGFINQLAADIFMLGLKLPISRAALTHKDLAATWADESRTLALQLCGLHDKETKAD